MLSNSDKLYAQPTIAYNAVMLSYRHSYHAGNHADVLKHAILSQILRYMTQKDKAFTFFDTHAGSGKYRIELDEHPEKGDSFSGIRKIIEADDIPASLEAYASTCIRLSSDCQEYPGSPEIARMFTRPIDQIVLMELHPSEIPVLKANYASEKRIHIHHRDGFAGLLALTPPQTSRGLAHIDPSYETINDWVKAADTLASVHKKWPAGILVLWYPVVGRKLEECNAMKQKLASSQIPGILDAELLVADVRSGPDGFGLSGSGMIIVNPPWTLHDEIAEFLPWLASVLGENGAGRWKLEWLSEPS